MKNKLLADALIVMVLSMLPNTLMAVDASANRPAEQKPSIGPTCEQSIQLIPMLMGHTNLAQFALLGLQFPEETLDPVNMERVIQIRETQQPLPINVPCVLNRGKATCGGMLRMMECRPARQRFIGI
mgnify:FL=1